jgi:hypothetical protein
MQQTADRSRVLSEVQSAADTKTSSVLNLAVAVLSGPGGAGKTSACLAIQGKPLPADRESTRGGDGMALVVRVKKEELLGFEKPRGDLNHLQRALLHRLLKQRGATLDAGDVDLSHFVSGLDAHDNIAELHRQLQATGGGLAVMEVIDTLDVTPQTPSAPVSSPPHGGGGPGPVAGRGRPHTVAPPPRPEKNAIDRGSAAPHPKPIPAPIVPEQIHVTRETAVVMRAQQEAGGHDDQDGVHTLIFDLGGQPEFWPLVGEFLRE